MLFFDSHQDEDNLFLVWGTALVPRVTRKADKCVSGALLFCEMKQWGPTPTPRSDTWTYIHYASKAHYISSLKMKLVWKFRGILDPGLVVGTQREKWETMLTSVKISSPYADQANHSYCAKECGLRKKSFNVGSDFTRCWTHCAPYLQGNPRTWRISVSLTPLWKICFMVGFICWDKGGWRCWKPENWVISQLWEKEQRQSGEKMQKQDVLFIC